MFPERVDKVVLDGNINVHEYYSGWYVNTRLAQKVEMFDMVQGNRKFHQHGRRLRRSILRLRCRR